MLSCQKHLITCSYCCAMNVTETTTTTTTATAVAIDPMLGVPHEKFTKRGQRWTKEEDFLIQAAKANGSCIKPVADNIGRTEAAVVSRLSAISRKKRYNGTDPKDGFVCDAWLPTEAKRLSPIRSSITKRPKKLPEHYSSILSSAASIGKGTYWDLARSTRRAKVDSMQVEHVMSYDAPLNADRRDVAFKVHYNTGADLLDSSHSGEEPNTPFDAQCDESGMTDDSSSSLSPSLDNSPDVLSPNNIDDRSEMYKLVINDNDEDERYLFNIDDNEEILKSMSHALAPSMYETHIGLHVTVSDLSPTHTLTINADEITLIAVWNPKEKKGTCGQQIIQFTLSEGNFSGFVVEKGISREKEGDISFIALKSKKNAQLEIF